jgi:transcriptional regulator GlxA family with amidase domain
MAGIVGNLSLRTQVVSGTITPKVLPPDRNIAILVYPGVQSLDVTGPLEVFSAARQLFGRGGAGGEHGEPVERGRDGYDRHIKPGYRTYVISPDGAPLETSSGLTLVPHAAIGEAPRAIDTLIVAGGLGVKHLCEDGSTLAWIVDCAAHARRVASVCTGAFALAAAGLLDGRRAATHWAAATQLARRYPKVHVDPEPIFVRDGAVWTSAGVTAGMDLALALLEDDLDREAALAVARHLVLFLRRPGNQSQFSATLAAQAPARDALREVQRFAAENLAADLTVEALAARAHMSARHFARSFRAQTAITPARYVERLRLEAARRALEESCEPLTSVAAGCGFGTPETMRRTFLRALGVGPAEYRRRFQVHDTVAPGRHTDLAA